MQYGVSGEKLKKYPEDEQDDRREDGQQEVEGLTAESQNNHIMKMGWSEMSARQTWADVDVTSKMCSCRYEKMWRVMCCSHFHLPFLRFLPSPFFTITLFFPLLLPFPSLSSPLPFVPSPFVPPIYHFSFCSFSLPFFHRFFPFPLFPPFSQLFLTLFLSPFHPFCSLSVPWLIPFYPLFITNSPFFPFCPFSLSPFFSLLPFSPFLTIFPFFLLFLPTLPLPPLSPFRPFSLPPFLHSPPLPFPHFRLLPFVFATYGIDKEELVQVALLQIHGGDGAYLLVLLGSLFGVSSVHFCQMCSARYTSFFLYLSNSSVDGRSVKSLCANSSISMHFSSVQRLLSCESRKNKSFWKWSWIPLKFLLIHLLLALWTMKCCFCASVLPCRAPRGRPSWWHSSGLREHPIAIGEDVGWIHFLWRDAHKCNKLFLDSNIEGILSIAPFECPCHESSSLIFHYMGCKHYFVADRLEVLLDEDDSRISSRVREHGSFRLVSHLHVAIQTLWNRCLFPHVMWTNR